MTEKLIKQTLVVTAATTAAVTLGLNAAQADDITASNQADLGQAAQTTANSATTAADVQTAQNDKEAAQQEAQKAQQAADLAKTAVTDQTKQVQVAQDNQTQAQADLKTATANTQTASENKDKDQQAVTKAQADNDQAQKAVQAAQGVVQQAQAQHDEQQKQVDKVQADLDLAKTAGDKAQTALDQDQATLNTTKKDLADKQTDLTAKEAELKAAQAGQGGQADPKAYQEALANQQKAQVAVDQAQAKVDAAQKQVDSLDKQTSYAITLPAGTKATDMINWSDSQWAQWAQQIKAAGYVHDPAAQAQNIDLNNLTAEQNQALQNYYGGLLNQLLKQAGQQPISVNAAGMLAGVKQVADGYSNDNWDIWTHADHNQKVLQQAYSNSHLNSVSENWGSSFDQGNKAGFDGHTTLDAAQEQIYETVLAMINNDGDSHWGHTKNFLMAKGQDVHGKSAKGYSAVAFDKMGASHFFSGLVADTNSAFNAAGATVPAGTTNPSQSLIDAQTILANAKKDLANSQVALQTAQDQVAKAAGQGKADTKALQAEIAQLKDAIAHGQKQVQELETNLPKLVEQAKDAKEIQATAQQNLATAKQAVSDGQANLVKQITVLNAAQKHASELANNLKQDQDKLAKDQNAAATQQAATKKVAEATQALADAQTLLKQLEEKSQAAQQEVSQAQGKYQAAASRYHDVVMAYQYEQQKAQKAANQAQGEVTPTANAATDKQATNNGGSTVAFNSAGGVVKSVAGNTTATANSAKLPQTASQTRTNSQALTLIGLSVVLVSSAFFGYKKYKD
ncbi:SEC10/PgrA surface exclusion domain-containing protein [Convivina intestini]|uniref:SEC10/PgrA surface exclusion-like protein n=1 Tax=Convivina intestini TaxID=1505726 RepID=A0A2U1DC18_9LACO|nr:SEC10/PgrA surface exclusion domain-containing protein [Convivina intestini]PVY85235.1 SEC10/PgrA surface exclusion-like protein [Convivina intestini]CAH1852538.1 Chromosome partition protein Smc [Convivina intestini]SDB87389.1 SEC10/PgrA surface exclusion domain-containing protein [Leuconostocaceae bacterium R-53105]